MAKRRRLRDTKGWETTKVVLIVVYTTIAVIFNCWLIGGYVLSAGRPTVILGTVKDVENGQPLAGAVVGVRLPEDSKSKEVSAATDAEGRYKLTLPASMDRYSLYCVYGSSAGVIVNAPTKPLSGPPKEGESQYQVVLHRVNTVDWEVSTR